MKTGYIKAVAAALLAAALTLTLASCSGLSLSSSDLMTAPRLTKQQEEIRLALEDSLGTKEFTFYSPRTGINRAAVMYADVCGSSDYEAVVLYSLTGKPDETRVHILTRGSDAAWATVCDFVPMEGASLNRIYFNRVMPTGYAQLVIGSLLYSGRENALTVWSVDSNVPENLFSAPYSEVLTGDITGDGTDEILIFNTIAEGGGTLVNLVDFAAEDGAIAVRTTQVIDVQFTQWLSISLSMLDTGSNAVYIDGRTDSGTYVTEVIGIVSGQLVNVFGENVPTRSQPIICRDINNDGVLEVPVQDILPGYADAAASDRIPRIDWCSCGVAGLTVLYSSAVNMKWEYIFIIPNELNSQVTFVAEDGNGCWTLYTWDAAQQSTAQRILAIRSHIASDWDETGDIHPEQILFAKQDNVYYTVQFYLDSVMTYDEFCDLFIAI